MAVYIPNGLQKYVTMGTAPDISGTDFSMVSFLYPLSYPAGGRAYGRANTTATAPFIQYGLELSSSPRVLFLLTINNTLRFVNIAGKPFPENTWSVVTCTYDGTTMKVFRNKETTPIGTANFSGTITSKSGWVFNVGVMEYQKAQATAYFDGYIRGVQLYNKVLSQSEINTINDDGGCSTGSSNVVGNWLFSTQSGILTTEPDLSGSGNDGSGVNSPTYISDPYGLCGSVARRLVNIYNFNEVGGLTCH